MMVSILFFGENGRIIKPQIARISPIQLESPIQGPETQSTFHPHAQRSAFRRRGARQQALSPLANH
jgi:hypothetical protein